jgi:NitT/TauT family transport system substrate-binding protein
MKGSTSRRAFVRLAFGATASVSLAWLSGCAPSAPAAKPTEAPAKAAAAPAAPAPAASPAAAAQSAPAAPAASPAAAAPAVKAAPKAAGKIRYGGTGTNEEIAWRVATQQGIFAKNGLEYEPTPFAGPEAVPTAFQGGTIDGSTAGLATMVQIRSQGNLVNVAFGTDFLLHDVLVMKDSKINSFADLKGAKVGLFGGPAGHGANLLKSLCIAFFGFDLDKEASVQYGAPPLLAGSLEKGDLDAVLLLDPFTSTLLTGEKVRSVGDTTKVYREKTGDNTALIAGSMAIRQAYTEQNPDAVTALIASFLEAGRYLQANPQAWIDASKDLGYKDEAVVKMMVERRGRNFYPSEWNDEIIAGQLRALEFIQKHTGTAFLQTIDKATLTAKYVPKSA